MMRKMGKETVVKYIFEEYRDGKGIGKVSAFDTKEEALQIAQDEWDGLCYKDKKSYLDEAGTCFYVYKAKIPVNEWKELQDPYGCPEKTESEYCVEDIKDFLHEE